MEIKKRLILTGANEVNAVLLNDEGEEYPVFLESLHNTIIFPALMESGYTLTALPYGFVKNGVAFDALPVENYAVNTAQLEIMYNSTGVKLSNDELKSHINIEEAVGIPTPVTNYTIFTREDLIKFLEATEVASVDEDFMPLNYFVAPEARFSLDEYKDLENHRYIQLINKRREMSLRKFHMLVKALQQINLGPNPSAMDVLDAYFAWGMDGLDFTVMGKRRESRAFRLNTNHSVNAPIVRKTIGFIDGMGNQLTPMHERNVVWKLPTDDEKSIQDLISGMQANDTRVVEFRAPAKQEVTVMEGVKYNIQYNEELLVMQLQTYPSIRVKSPVEVGSYIELKQALPDKMELLTTHCTIDALARMLYNYRKPRVKVSTYNALKVSGCNPKTILDYVVTYNDMSKSSKLNSEESLPEIWDYDIDNYLNGENVSDEIRAFLDDVVDGVYNIDNIEAGKKIEGQASTESVYKEIYALHYVMGIEFQDIYDKFRSINPEMRSITFSNGEINHTMNVAPLTYSTQGYERDVQMYDLQNAKECNFFIFVDKVAREVGSESANRHVGIEFFLVNKKYKPVQEILLQLRKDFEEKVNMKITDVSRRMEAMKFIDMFCLSRYFEVAFKGTITYPNFLGGGSVPALPSMTETCKKYIERRIENLTTYCSFTTNTVSSSKLSFSAYCVNAYITPEYVIPRGNNIIHEVPFYTLWVDWKSVNPGVWQQLVNIGAIPIDFVAWEIRYGSEQFKQRDLFNLDEEDSLLYYYNHAVESVRFYPADKEFVSVKHPMEYMFPGLYVNDAEEEYVKLPALRQGEPVVRLGLFRDIKLDDYRDKLYPSEEVSALDSYIKQLSGLSADVIMRVPDVFDKLPTDKVCSITVLPKSESIYLSDTGEVCNFRKLVELSSEKYPFIHLYDRLYILKGADGKLWEVCI